MGVISSDLQLEPIGWSRKAMQELAVFWKENSGAHLLWEPVFRPYEIGTCHIDLSSMSPDQIRAFKDLLTTFAETREERATGKNTLTAIIAMIEELDQSKCPH